MNDTISDLIHIGIYALVFCTALSAFILLLKYGNMNVSSLEKDNMQKSSITMDFGSDQAKDERLDYDRSVVETMGGRYIDKPISKDDVYADILSISDRYDEEDLENGSPVVIQIDNRKIGKGEVVIMSHAKLDDATDNEDGTKEYKSHDGDGKKMDYSLLDLHNREKRAMLTLLNDHLMEDGMYQRHYVYDEDYVLTNVIYTLS